MSATGLVVWRAVGVRVVQSSDQRYHVVVTRWPGRECPDTRHWWVHDSLREAVAQARRFERVRKSTRAGYSVGSATRPTGRSKRRPVPPWPPLVEVAPATW